MVDTCGKSIDRHFSEGLVSYLAFSTTNEPKRRVTIKPTVQVSASDPDIAVYVTAMRSFSMLKLTRPSVANVAQFSKRLRNR